MVALTEDRNTPRRQGDDFVFPMAASVTIFAGALVMLDAAGNATIHQEGGTIRPRADSGKKALNTPFGPLGAVNMPQRAFLGFGEAERVGIHDILHGFLADAWAGRSA